MICISNKFDCLMRVDLLWQRLGRLVEVTNMYWMKYQDRVEPSNALQEFPYEHYVK